MEENYEWINDYVAKCNTCESIFKCYFLDECGQTGFCPNCGSRDLIDVYEED